MIIGNDYEGFEKEEKLHEIFPKVSEIQNTLQKWGDFIEVAQIINPDLCLGAFDRRPCKRTLRYVGNESNPEPHSYFVRGEIYHTIDFNGATYSIEGYVNDSGAHKRIGFVYFEWLKYGEYVSANMAELQE